MSGHAPGKHVAVVYLARHAEGPEHFRRFADSYVRHPAGVDHDLVILYKGFDQTQSLYAARAIFERVPHTGIELPDAGFDIGAYLSAARRLDHDYLCFLNTFSMVEANGWLQSLYQHASSPEVGIVGAMGSYESLHSTLKVSHKVRWLCNEAAIPYDARFHRYFRFIIRTACREWAEAGTGERLSHWDRYLERAKTLGWRYRSSASIGDFFCKPAGGVQRDVEFERRWDVLVSFGGYFSEYARFKAFPNPHVRSNGFMLRRRQFLDLGLRAPERKMDAWALESGERSITASIASLGLRTVVVGADSASFDVKDWVRSRTFRLSDQGNLLVTDNQTRKFSVATVDDRITQTRLAWGDCAGPAPLDYPSLGISFAVDPVATGN